MNPIGLIAEDVDAYEPIRLDRDGLAAPWARSRISGPGS
jgi:hypothetical protein